MPVPTVITELSTTAASNSPAGSETVGTNVDDYFRAAFAFEAQLYAGSTSVSAGMLKSTGTSISAATADVDYQSALTSASQAEMETGTESAVRKMSPLRVAQAINALSANDQIQGISAAVGSNALTISAGVLTLDFRSATLGAGTITRVSGDPADLVISSGSTLGTVSGVASRIAVVAMNNAGTIELAATNIAGGVSLDEAGLISTTAEGGAGGADTAGVVYSTTARTNLAYRVLGYIESTQATAGTWATAPSTIQGAGGQSVVGLAATERAWTAPGKAKSTTYTNTGRYDREVSVSGTGGVAVLALVVTQNGVSVTVSQAQPDGASGIVNVYGTVPPGATYEVTFAGTITSWAERG